MELTDEQKQIIEANNGEVPPDLAAALLNGYGETGTVSPESSEPNTAQVSEQEPADAGTGEPAAQPDVQTAATNDADTAQQPNDADLNADNAVVLAKDGKHTIPFDRLTEARESAQQYKQQAEQAQQQAELANQKLAEFQQKMAEQASQPQTQQAQQNQAIAEAAVAASGNSAEVMALLGDFSEEAIAAGVDKLVDTRVIAQVQAVLAPYLQQQQASQEQTAYNSHMNAILNVHPDAPSVVESVEFNKWLDEQPNVVRSAYNNVLDNGSATDVNEVLSLYKTQSNASTNTADTGKPDLIEAAKQAVTKAQTQVPHSVSDFPAGSPAGVSREDRLAAMNPQQLANEMSDWKTEEIEAYMNRNA
ncbi:hypothetical protein [Acinetobacter entericus]|uniref:Phage protein n=1 Tax=Acinetobacter entericus TaxID=2989714 RepID=A0ABT3NEH4_9GAMM|nr:hypothetical protein [Acinetobacter entericus]MCW8037941.1 hypothetical protein [Acinetobacter entericus]